MTTATLIKEAKATGQDFEFYPTTDEIIRRLVSRIKTNDRGYGHSSRNIDVLDIGAGNGKVLKALKDAEAVGTLYAIEKSKPLLQAMPSEVFVIGTDFEEQTLFDKDAGFTFCNPPYSQFVDWTEKIIRETASHHVYLVIPQRWKDDKRISEAIAYRDAKTDVIGSFDFENAEDRKARAKVDLIEIAMPSRSKDAFSLFFDQEFSHLKAKMEGKAEPTEEDADEDEKINSAIVGRKDFIAALVTLYQDRMNHIRQNYAALNELDPALLKELEIDIPKIRELLRQRLTNLKKHYWKQVFDNLDKITDRLTSKSRSAMLATLFENTHVDFTLGNAYAVVLWTIRNANDYYESQFIELYQDMVSKANAHNYKSNKRVFEWDNWRYKDENTATHFALNYRIVLERSGGIHVSEWGRWEAERYNGLNERGFQFLADLATIARNLGFSNPDSPAAFEWESRKMNEFFYTDENGERRTLMEVRAFQNQNIHVRFAGEFALALNVEFGRLQGWIRTGNEAAEELNDPDAPKHFQTLHQVRITDAARMIGSAPEASQEENEAEQPAATIEREKPQEKAAKPECKQPAPRARKPEPKPETPEEVTAGINAALEQMQLTF